MTGDGEQAEERAREQRGEATGFEDRSAACDRPRFDNGSWRALDPRGVTVARIGAWIAVGVVTPPLVTGAVLLVVLAPLPRWLTLALPIVVAAVLIGLGWLAHRWPPISHRHRGWRLDRDRFEIRRGVLWHQVISVPRSRVQHTDVAQAPVERGHDLARLVVHTAGTAGASVTLEGLALATAEAVRDHLVAHESDDGR